MTPERLKEIKMRCEAIRQHGSWCGISPHEHLSLLDEIEAKGEEIRRLRETLEGTLKLARIIEIIEGIHPKTVQLARDTAELIETKQQALAPKENDGQKVK